MIMEPEIIGSIAGAGLSTLGSLLGASYSQDYNRENIGLQAAAAKGLADYHWKNFSSPEAQVRALNKVGLGVNAFVGGKGQAAQPSMNMPSSAPVSVDGIADLGAISSYILSVAQAKKAGMDTNLAEQEIKNKQVQQQADEFKLSLAKKYGNDELAAKVANSYMQLVLASDQSDLNEIEKSIKRYEDITAQYVSQIKESERDMARQDLENNPTLIRLKNRLVKNQGTAAAAAAEASHTQANVNRELRRINAALAEVEESTKDDKILSLISEYQKNGWISEADASEARLRASRLHTQENLRDSSKLWKAADDMFDWLKQKVSIFGK